MAFPTAGKLLLDSFQKKPAPLVRRTDMESGPAKQARIAQRRRVAYSMTYEYTPAEYAAFEAWLDSEGANSSFDWTDPTDDTLKTAQLLLGQYEAKPVQAGEDEPLNWQVTLVLEIYE